jgi:hypothetical protein
VDRSVALAPSINPTSDFNPNPDPNLEPNQAAVGRSGGAAGCLSERVGADSGAGTLRPNLSATSLRPLFALSPPSLRPHSARSSPSLRPLSALTPPALRPLSALFSPFLRPLFALSSPSLHFCACSVHPLHSNQAVVVRQRAPASSCVARPGACRPATALPHPRWLRSHPFSSLRTAPPPPHPPTHPWGASFGPDREGRRFDASHSAPRSALRNESGAPLEALALAWRHQRQWFLSRCAPFCHGHPGWQIQSLPPNRYRTAPSAATATDRLSPGGGQSTQQQRRLVVHAPPQLHSGTPPFTPAAAYSSPSFPVRKRPSSAVPVARR